MQEGGIHYLPSIISYYRLLDNDASIRERHVL